LLDEKRFTDPNQEKEAVSSQQDLFGLIPNELLSSPAGIGAIASTASTSDVSVDAHWQGITYLKSHQSVTGCQNFRV
jgi:hypothetical protein